MSSSAERKKKNQEVLDKLIPYKHLPRPEGASSAVWNYFLYDKDIHRTKAICTLCGSSITYLTEFTVQKSDKDDKSKEYRCSTGGLKDHLADVHHIWNMPEHLVIVQPKSTLNKNTITKFFDKQENTPSRDERIKAIAKFFVLSGVARDIITKDHCKEAFGLEWPKNLTKGEFERSIHLLANEIKLQIKQRLKGLCTCIEMDAGKKGQMDYNNVVGGGLFLESKVIDFSETEGNVTSEIKELYTRLEKEYECVFINSSSDNCKKWDQPLHKIAVDLGVIHTHDAPHSYNLAYSQTWVSSPKMILIFSKIMTSTKLIRNRKAIGREYAKYYQQEFETKKVLWPITPAGTRWSFKNNTWQRFLRTMKPILRVLDSNNWKNKKVKDLVKEPEFDEVMSLLKEIEFTDEEGNPFTQEAFQQQFEDERDEDEEEEIERQEDEKFGFDPEEQEYIHNIYHGFIHQHQVWCVRFQADRFSAQELVCWYQELRWISLSVQQWDEKKLPWITTLKMDYHKTAKQDITDLWLKFAKIVDQRSSQFNDRLLVILEELNPFPLGLQRSFTDGKDVVNDFIGNVSLDQSPAMLEDKADRMFNIGSKVTLKILHMKDKAAHNLTLEKVQEGLITDWTNWLDRSYWNGKYQGKNDPLSFWKWMSTQKYFPFLSHLMVELWRLSISSVNVERSFKDHGRILRPTRNRLAPAKQSDELMIVYNHKAFKRIDDRESRVCEAYSFHEKQYNLLKPDIRVETDFIAMIDGLAEISKKNKEIVKNQEDVIEEENEMESTTSGRTPLDQHVKKTRFWKAILENPEDALELIPKKRNPNSKKKRLYCDVTDDEDPDYKEE